MARFYTVEKLGEKQSETPEGFLVCLDVAIARTGVMLYGEGEVPLDAKYGLIEVTRDENEVFREETMASFEGKSVTIDHPEEFVCPLNFKDLEVGTVQNIRRGTGSEDNLLIADLLIKDKSAIDMVKKGLREVSCGYDADYEQVAAGKGVQRNIVGNHVALVDKGRCGSRCSIGDKEKVMPTKNTTADKKAKRVSFADRLRRAFMSKDAEAAEKLAKEAEDADMDEDEDDTANTNDDDGDDKDSKTADALNLVLRKLKSMDADIQELKKAKAKDADTKGDDDEDESGKTGDDGDLTEAERAERLDQDGVKNYTGDKAWSDLRARTEILSPGFRVPTVDKKTNTKDAALKLCGCKRRVLDEAFKTEDGKNAITPFLGGREPTFDTLPMSTIDAAFIGASELMKAKNNQTGVRSGIKTSDFGRPPLSPAALNAANRQFWKDQQPK